MAEHILVINPGSTTTKVAVYDGEEELFSKTIDHPAELIEKFDEIADQFSMRRKSIDEILVEFNVDKSRLSAVVGRGGLLQGLKAGGYQVNEALVEAFKSDKASPHASNLGASLAYDIAKSLGIPAFIYDSEASDEFAEVARVTGMKSHVIKPMCHVLNQKAVARKIAKEKYEKNYGEFKTVVAHMGGGITVGAHDRGEIVDSVRDDAGPFSPERSGRVPLLDFIDICSTGEYTKKEMIKMVRGNAGVKVLMGTTDMRKVEDMALEGDEKAMLVYKAMAYQVAKAIGEMATVLCCDMDCIILTGGIAYSKLMTNLISERVEKIAPIEIVPGEFEMEALTLGTLRILRNEEEAKIYR